MRKFTILGLALCLATITAVRGQDTRLLSDRAIQHKLTGTWYSSWGRGLTTTNIIAADGSYVSKTVGLPNGVTESYHGTFLVTNGMVVGNAIIGKETVNLRLQLIRLDSHELVWSNELEATESTFHKVGR
jgi:hypothetical protein